MPDDATTPHDDFDTDSLFGSPPASPARGRSPSPLALPGGQNSVHNVGTLALPGSHPCSELPSVLLPAPPVNPAPDARRTPQRVADAPSRRPSRPPPIQTASQPGSSRDGSAQRKSRRPSRRSTPATESRPTPPPITLPSPTDPPPANFLRNQQALLGHAGLISGVHPATLALQRHTRGESPSNPIVVEDEDRPSIGRRPLYGGNTFHGNLPVPSGEEVLSNLVKQKNLVPVLNALIRLVVGSTYGTTYPSPYQTPYASSYYNSNGYPPQPQPTSFHRPYNPNFNPPARSPTPAPEAQPQPKRRKLSHVPAGAGDWDVPYPFPEGQGPPDYAKNWQRMRSQQLLDDLVGLIKSAAKKAAVQKAQVDSMLSGSAGHPPVGSVEYYRDRILRNYGSYPPLGGPYAPYAASQGGTSAQSGTSTDATGTSSSNSPNPVAPAAQRTFDIPVVGEPQPAPLPAFSIPSTPAVSNAVSHQSTVASPVHSSSQPDPVPVPPTIDTTVPNAPVEASDTANSLQDLTQNNIDDLLAVFNDLPASDLDELLTSTDFSSFNTDNMDFMQAFDMPTSDTQGGSAVADSGLPSLGLSDDFAAFPTDANFDPNMFDFDGSLAMFDQDLAAFSSIPDPVSGPSTSVLPDAQSQPQPPPIQTAIDTSASGSGLGSGAPPTPTLAGSPLSQIDYDPPTPSWNFNFPEPDIATGSTEGTPRPGTGGNGSEGSQTDGVDAERRRSDKGKGKGRAVEVEGDVESVTTSVEPPAPAPVSTVEAHQASLVSTATLNALEPAPQVSTFAPASSSQPIPSTSSSAPPMDAYDILEPLRKTIEAYLPQSSTNSSLSGSSLFVPPPLVPIRPRPATSAPPPKPREEVLRRARVMRGQLAKEIERAKIELWESAMEGGCLAVFAKERDKVGRR